MFSLCLFYQGTSFSNSFSLSCSYDGSTRHRFGARVKESVAASGRSRCGKAILICAHSHQCHSAWLVSVWKHQSSLSGTAVTSSNRYHLKIRHLAHCVWLAPSGSGPPSPWMNGPTLSGTWMARRRA